MRRRAWRIWWTVAVGTLLTGCGHGEVRKSYPPDPLLLNKRPIENKTAKGSAGSTAAGEPLLPPLPTVSLASAPPTYREVAQVQVSAVEANPTH